MKANRPTRSAPTRGALFTTPLRRSGYTTVVRAHLFGVDADRKKPIDGYIDYFGGGGANRTMGAAYPRVGSVPGSGGAR
jgi:hypothetical protein